jgi:solute:Na+ symporter, SSS family
MQYLSTGDAAVITLYLVILLGIGIYLSRCASQSMGDHFVAGRKMPRWALGISGLKTYIAERKGGRELR